MIYKILVIASIFFFLYILNLVRTKKINENLSLLWLVLPLGIIILVTFRKYLDQFAHYIGVEYAPALYLLATIIFLLILILNLTTMIYKNSERTKKLTQELSILKNNKEQKK